MRLTLGHILLIIVSLHTTPALATEKVANAVSHPLAQGKEIVTADDRIAKYTFALDWLTAALVTVTAIQLIFVYRADKTAKITAEAARDSARAAIGIELPIIKAFTPNDLLDLSAPIPPSGPYGLSESFGPPGRYSALSSLEFKNYGRTVAFVEKLIIGWNVIEKLPVLPNFAHIVPIERGTIIKEDKQLRIDPSITIELTDAQIALISQEEASLWVYGTLFYQDFLDSYHTAKFCWRWTKDEGGPNFSFKNDGDPPVAYTKNT
ncbi:MAG TPA: hypothetical protein VF939_20980 [Puia sp.]